MFNIEIATLRPAIIELERAMDWASQRLDGGNLKIVPVIQTKGRMGNCAGWFQSDAWSTREGESVAEISMVAEALDRDPVTILATILHEVCPAHNSAHGITDCAANQRHNKAFASTAEQIGLTVAPPTDWRGFAYTSISEDFRIEIEKDFKPDYTAWNLFRRGGSKSSRRATPKTVPWECGCDYKVRVATGIDLYAICQTCDEYFERVD